MAKKIQSNDDSEKQSHGGRKTKQDNGGSVTVVLKIDMHCEGCAGKIAKAVRSLNGVESVKKGDNELKKIMVIGNVDPVELRQKVENKIKKKVELISPVIKNQNASPATATAVKDENKTKKFPVTTTMLKVSLHCQGCIDKIQKLVKKTDGFLDMSIDKSNDLVTVKGGLDVNELAAALKDKLKRKVEIVPEKNSGGGDGKKGKGGGGDEKNGGGGDGEGTESGGGGRKVEGYKMEYYGGQSQYTYPQYVNGAGYTFNYMHATQMFNDDNTNACVVM